MDLIWTIRRKALHGDLCERIYFTIHRIYRRDVLYERLDTLRNAGCNDSSRYLKVLLVFFGKRHSHHVNKMLYVLSDCLADLGAKNKDAFYNNRIRLKEILEELSYKELSFYKWSVLTGILYRNLMCVCASMARQKMVEIALRRKEPEFDLDKVQVYFEHGEYSKGKNLLKESRFFNSNDLGISIIKNQFITIFDCLLRDKAPVEYAIEDKKFLEYLKGRIVHIFAPGYRDNYNQLLNGVSEKDSRAMISYLYDGSQAEIEEIVKPDIMFYNMERYWELCDLKDKSFLDNIEFVSTKADEYNEIDSVYLNKVRKMFPKSGREYLFLRGEPNMIQAIAIDLIHFKVEFVMHNANLFYAERLYNASNARGFDYRRLSTIDGHDLVSNFRMTKNMYNAGAFKADEMLESVLKLREEEYLRGVESFFSEQFFDAS